MPRSREPRIKPQSAIHPHRRNSKQPSPVIRRGDNYREGDTSDRGAAIRRYKAAGQQLPENLQLTDDKRHARARSSQQRRLTWLQYHPVQK